jgi:hypothetical protein
MLPPVQPPPAQPTPAARPPFAQPPSRPAGRPAASGQSRRSGSARAAIRTAADPAARPATPAGPAVPGRAGQNRAAVNRAASHQAASHQAGRRPAASAAARAQAASAAARTAPPAATRLPWYEIAENNRTVAGWRDCGSLEAVLQREWTAEPPAEAVTAIDRLASLPRLIKDRLAVGLDAIHVGGGGVPDLDDMGRLHGVPLPSGRATWDACAGAYGERKIVVGSRPSPTPDVMCHEVGHALDDIDGLGGQWQSDSDEFCALYAQCQPHLVSNLHAQRGILGRREFFADAFAAIASRQRPALVDMLGGDTRAALNVMLYFNMRYGI